MNPLKSILGTIITGFVVALIIIFILGTTGTINPWGFWVWMHVLAGITWIGLLYYFNFVQMPALPRIPEAQRPAIARFIAPAALFWFRWAAVATVLTGLLLAQAQGILGAALGLGRGVQAIGLGMWLGLAMAANVWFVIWPSQKKALGMVPADPAVRAAAAIRAAQASRINLLLSVPMLYCMVAQQNGGL